MIVAESYVEQLAQQGWTYHAYRPAVAGGDEGWALAVEKESTRIIVFADTFERAFLLAVQVVERRNRSRVGRPFAEGPW
jgi:hypothetical protein